MELQLQLHTSGGRVVVFKDFTKTIYYQTAALHPSLASHANIGWRCQ